MIQISSALQNCVIRADAPAAASGVDCAIDGLLALVKARDPELMAHSMSVARLSIRVAAGLDLSAWQIGEVRRAALIHDIGKLALPDAVLHKPGPLSAQEVELIQQHPVLSYRMAIALGLRHEARWVRHHHERPDGLGYPDGLRAGQIPAASEIIHVADAYDALVTDRPYRRALTHGDALAEIVAGSGWEFDRDCVSALVATVARRRFRA